MRVFTGSLCPSLSYIHHAEVWVYSAMYLSACTRASADLWRLAYFSQLCAGSCFPLEGNNSFTQMSYCFVYLQRHPQLVCILSSPWLCSLCGDIAVMSAYLYRLALLCGSLPHHVKKLHFSI